MKICIATPQLEVYSETFIRQHITKLPFDVVVLSGGKLDQANGRWLLKQTFVQRLYHKLLQKIGRFDKRKFEIRQIANWMRKEGVNAVLAEYGLTGLQIMDACQEAGVPLVVHFHGYDAHNEEMISPHLEGYRRMFEKASAIIGVSRLMCHRLQDLGVSPAKINYVPYYVDTKLFKLVSPDKALRLFLTVGRFVEKKAPHLTILAFSKVLISCPDARLEMVGNGPLLGSCKWLARSLNIEHAIVFHGSKDHEWIAVAMSRVRAFIQHSVRAENGDSEGTPVAVLEAQCSGLPVIATSHAGIADVVVDGQTGFLCEEGDIEKMAHAMVQICQASPEFIQTMSAAARKRFTREFAHDKTMGKLADVIRSFIT